MSERIVSKSKGWKRRTHSKDSLPLIGGPVQVVATQQNTAAVSGESREEHLAVSAQKKTPLKKRKRRAPLFTLKKKPRNQEASRNAPEQRLKSKKSSEEPQDEQTSESALPEKPASKQFAKAKAKPGTGLGRDFAKINKYREAILASANEAIRKERELSNGKIEQYPPQKVSFNKKAKVLEYMQVTRRPPSYHAAKPEVTEKEVQFKSVIKGSTNTYSQRISISNLSVFCDKFVLFEDDVHSSQST